MGPVSFESLDAGGSRADALAAAARLAEAGIRVVQMDEAPASRPGPSGDGRFRLVVRSADAARARNVLAAHL
ncbi:MAG: DUF2007 domain-containing protein [Acidimicrobiia bacterium]|nr:DUF2007 domain-containing protein [Acidimicrobiia bacterium]MDH5289263.1 DUF2007 domain-containing protein [Acidimicrobiia bacterium]